MFYVFCLSTVYFIGMISQTSGPMLSMGQNVHIFVCLSVCVFTFEVPFNGLFAPLPEVGCPVFLEIRNPWGKVMERSGLTFEQFYLEVV
jgi:hypothetical protein